jgi:hypothetical protein
MRFSASEAVEIIEFAKGLQRVRGGRFRDACRHAVRIVKAERQTGQRPGDDGDDALGAVEERSLARRRIAYRGNAALAILIPLAGVATIVAALAFGLLQGPIADFVEASSTSWSTRIAN